MTRLWCRIVCFYQLFSICLCIRPIWKIEREVGNTTSNVLDINKIIEAIFADHDEKSAYTDVSHNQSSARIDRLQKRVATYCRTPNGDISLCIPLQDCPRLMDQLSNKDAHRFLKASRCGPKNEVKSNPEVCCGDSAETTETPTPIPDSLEDKKELLAKPEECGSQMLNSRIRGGTKTNLEEFGWIALIKYKNTAGHVQHGCHGSLISKKYVVSAAHCFQTSYSDNLGNASSVVLGEYDTTTEKDCLFDGYCAAPVQEFSIDSVRIHENFDLRSVANDIALIRLNRPAIFSTFVRPICFPLDYVPLKKNKPLWISGWGTTENKTKSTLKLKAKIKYLTSEDCKDLIYFTTGDTQICAGSDDGSDSCKGDSGGPLMVKRASKMFLVGVVSFGIRCGARAAIYTNVTHYRDWILKNMEA